MSKSILSPYTPRRLSESLVKRLEKELGQAFVVIYGNEGPYRRGDKIFWDPSVFWCGMDKNTLKQFLKDIGSRN